MINPNPLEAKAKLLLIVCLLSLSGIAQTVQGYGDSNTAGWGATAPQYAWFNLVTSDLSITGYNYGAPRQTIYGSAGLQGQIAYAATNPHDYVTIMFGTNDAYNLTITSQWKDDYESYIKQGFIDQGYDKNKIILISPQYPSDTVNVYADNPNYIPQLRMIQGYCAQIAQDLGIKFIDLFGDMQFQFYANYNSGYHKSAGWYSDEFHLGNYGHRLLADLVERAIKSLPDPETGMQVKLFGAGSAVAGYTNYQHCFVDLFASAINKSCHNFGTVGSGVMPGSDTLQMNTQIAHGAEGAKDIALFFYGQNDGTPNDTYRTTYEQYLQQGFLNIGYDPQNIVVITIPMSPDIFTQDPYNGSRLLKFNQLNRQVASDLGVRILDAENLFFNMPDSGRSLFSDKYHFGNAGHQAVADYLQQMFVAGGAVKTLPIKAGSLKVVRNSDGTFTASFVASETTHTKEFILKYSEDGKNFKQIWHLFPERLQQEKQYTFTFSIN